MVESNVLVFVYVVVTMLLSFPYVVMNSTL